MKKQWLLVLLVLVVASVFRFYKIDSVPPGLYSDEAMNGNNALEAISTGNYKIFYPENNGREGLFINIQALSLKVFGPSTGSGQANSPWVLRVVSALFGTLTVLGLFFLTRKLFNWQIATLSSYLLAISFWHVNFSRIGFRAIMAPMLLVWALFFFWRGFTGKIWNFAISGILWGLGFYTYIAFRTAPLIIVTSLLVYWSAIKNHFVGPRYEHTRNEIARGLATFLVALIITVLPIAWYFYTNPHDFFGRLGQVSIFANGNPILNLLFNGVKTLGMFNIIGDFNWRHNIAGAPLIVWPIGIFFFVGFVRSWIKLFKAKREHGHFSSTQTLLLSWFFIGLAPVVLSNEGLPHALRAILVAPVCFIFAGEGLWWAYDKVADWYRLKDPHMLSKNGKLVSEGSVVAVFVLAMFLSSVTVVEFNRYFKQWAKNPEVAGAFSQNYVDLGNKLNQMPRNVKKYVLVNAGGVLVRGIPMSSQTVMFITDTFTPEKQKAKNIYYLTEEQYRNKQYDKKGVVIPLE